MELTSWINLPPLRSLFHRTTIRILAVLLVSAGPFGVASAAERSPVHGTKIEQRAWAEKALLAEGVVPSVRRIPLIKPVARRWAKRLFSVALIGFSTSGLPAHAQESSANIGPPAAETLFRAETKVLQQAARSALRVEFQSPDGKIYIGSAGVFRLPDGQKVICTNNHCIVSDQDRQRPVSVVRVIYHTGPDSVHRMEFEVIARAYEPMPELLDLAILRPRPDATAEDRRLVDEIPALDIAPAPQPGDRVGLIGYPNGELSMRRIDAQTVSSRSSVWDGNSPGMSGGMVISLEPDRLGYLGMPTWRRIDNSDPVGTFQPAWIIVPFAQRALRVAATPEFQQAWAADGRPAILEASVFPVRLRQMNFDNAFKLQRSLGEDFPLDGPLEVTHVHELAADGVADTRFLPRAGDVLRAFVLQDKQGNEIMRLPSTWDGIMAVRYLFDADLHQLVVPAFRDMRAINLDLGRPRARSEFGRDMLQRVGLQMRQEFLDDFAKGVRGMSSNQFADRGLRVVGIQDASTATSMSLSIGDIVTGVELEYGNIHDPFSDHSRRYVLTRDEFAFATPMLEDDVTQVRFNVLDQAGTLLWATPKDSRALGKALNAMWKTSLP
jgi:hypothetical protein